jgi:hypothetical protein
MADSSVPATLEVPLRLFFELFDGRLDLADPTADDAELGAGAAGKPVWIFSAAANPARSDAISSCLRSMLALQQTHTNRHFGQEQLVSRCELT